MSKQDVDPAFRTYAKRRGIKREIWYRSYWGGLRWHPVTIKGALVPFIAFAIAYGWGYLVIRLGLGAHAALLLVPPAIILIFTLILMILHTERG